MTCKYCGKILKESKGIQKQYCNELHKKAFNLCGAIDKIVKKSLSPRENINIKKKEKNNLRYKLFGKRYKNCTFENFIAKTDYQKDVKQTVFRIAENIKKGKGYIVAFIGRWGTGKDHLCAAMVHYIGFKKVMHKTIMQISRKIRESEKQQQEIDKLTSNDLLCINEIGLQSCTNFERNIIHEIIDTMLRDMKSCILITNNSKEEFQKCIDYPNTYRVWDRIDEKVIFKGESYRQKQRSKNNGNKN